jgi:hypothetical protein
LVRRLLLHFDLSTHLPQGTTIYRAHRVVDEWSELSVTWTNQPASAEGYGSTAIPLAFGWYSFDVTALVQARMNGTAAENGIMIRGPESPPYACAYREFYSKGGGGYGEAPELLVEYTTPAPALAASQNEFL